MLMLVNDYSIQIMKDCKNQFMGALASHSFSGAGVRAQTKFKNLVDGL
jgi:hypothetical protein